MSGTCAAWAKLLVAYRTGRQDQREAEQDRAIREATDAERKRADVDQDLDRGNRDDLIDRGVRRWSRPDD